MQKDPNPKKYKIPDISRFEFIMCTSIHCIINIHYFTLDKQCHMWIGWSKGHFMVTHHGKMNECINLSLNTECDSTPCHQAQIDERKHSASLAFMRGIHRWPVNSPYKGPVTRKMLPFDDVIMNGEQHMRILSFFLFATDFTKRCSIPSMIIH